MDTKEIGKRLKEIRQKQKYSIREVAEKTDMHFTYVSKIEQGQQSSLDKLQKLCDFYNIPIQSLFGEETNTPSELKEIGVEWITFAKEMEKQNLTPEEIKKYVEAVRILKGLE